MFTNKQVKTEPAPASPKPGRLAQLRAELLAEREIENTRNAEIIRMRSQIDVLEKQLALVPDGDQQGKVETARASLRSLSAANVKHRDTVVFLERRLAEAEQERERYTKLAAYLNAEVGAWEDVIIRARTCVDELMSIAESAKGLRVQVELHHNILHVHGVVQRLEAKQKELAQARNAITELGE